MVEGRLTAVWLGFRRTDWQIVVTADCHESFVAWRSPEQRCIGRLRKKGQTRKARSHENGLPNDKLLGKNPCVG